MKKNRQLLYDDYSLDYYRILGKKYKYGIRSFVDRCIHHNLQFVFYYRNYMIKHDFFSKFMLYKLKKKYGLEISSKCIIGKGFYVGHPYNITIGDGVILGKNVNVHKGCTIGTSNRGKIGSPVIGNNVYIGINSTIVGNISVGNDVLIAPNCYVNIDIPDHSVVIGNPAVIHSKLNATENYVNFTV